MKSSNSCMAMLTGLAWMCFANIACGQATITITFDELPFQSADGIVLNGVEIGFTVDGQSSTEAFYHSFGPGVSGAISDPSLTGASAGVLTFDFPVPTEILEFGAALNTADALSPGFEVELFDDAYASLGVTPVDTETSTGALGFSEAVFSYAGDPIARAQIRFAAANGDFALDNLKYHVPEPSSIAMLGIAACAQMFRRRR